MACLVSLTIFFAAHLVLCSAQVCLCEGDELVSEAYKKYLQLVARVEAFGQAIRQRYPGQVTCHAGCDGCCYQQFTVFPVEAYHLYQAVVRLTPAVRQRLQQRVREAADAFRMLDQSSPCVLLEHGRCILYEGRPLICRLHGYPLYSAMIERPDGMQRDCCPLNFSAMALDTLDAQAVFNLDLVNQTLAAINYVFVQEEGPPRQRVTIRQAVMAALHPGGVVISCGKVRKESYDI
jgi:Fe-S-cluster containining protein